MDGSFNFKGRTVEVVSAPSWSVEALRDVIGRAGEVVRLLADETVSDDHALRAAQALEPELARIAAALPGQPATRALQEFSDATRSAGSKSQGRGKVIRTLGAVCAFLIFYGDLKSGATSAISDASTVVQWVVSHAEGLPDWFKDYVLPMLVHNDVLDHRP